MLARLIFNPDAGRNRRRRLDQLAKLRFGLEQQGWHWTDGAGAEVVVVCGGDGTLHRAVNEWMTLPEPRPLLAVAPPCGTANIYAHALGVPQDASEAARWLARAQPRPMPVGQADWPDGRRQFFATVASAGYDAAIVQAMSATAKQRWGKLAFAYAALTQWPHYFPRPMAYEAGNLDGVADGLVMGLTRYYGGQLRLGEPAGQDAIVLALRGAPGALVAQGWGLLTRGLERSRGVERLSATTVALTTAGIPLELDGEPADPAPVRLSLADRRLCVLVA